MNSCANCKLEFATCWFLLPVVLLVLPLIALSGCGKSGPEVAPVTGHVTLDGKPLYNADVLFQPVDSKPPAFGRTEKDGSYELVYSRGVMGARVGQNTVRITVSGEVVPNPPKIAARFNTQSELHADVKAGEPNLFDFDVTTEPK